ncbi:hypothetical protein [Actinoplanes solisilvae]|uniref:hypothetical protein n=1 Tax=Actinoplanes solisilvae TaxID=2486853 RepID=UPI000FDC1B37|nr:hypothetical protein [Actinoplanes solisilvae]
MKRALSFTLVVSLIAACSNPPQDLTWSRINLPAYGRVVLTDVADCGDQWWAVGAIQASDGATRPAAWTGGPEGSWTPVDFAPLPSSYYGPLQTIRSVACFSGRVAMVGAVPGGAHGNPRVSTWRRLPDGRMTENAAPFETYGGDEAVDVGPIAAGPRGFAIAGNRSSGAAAWFSADGVTFTLSESRHAGTVARDVTSLPDGRWLIVGDGTWLEPWAEEDVPVFERVVRAGDVVLAAGGSGVWRRRDGAWSMAETYEGIPPSVRSMAVLAGHSVIAGNGLRIAGQRRNSPGEPVAVAARDTTLLLATDDSLWHTTVHR